MGGYLYSKAKIVKLHVCVVKVKLLLLPQSTLDPLHWVEFWEGWGQSLSAAAAAKGWPVTLWLPPPRWTTILLLASSSRGAAPHYLPKPLTVIKSACWLISGSQYSTVEQLGCPHISLRSETKRNGSVNEQSEIAKQKVSFACFAIKRNGKFGMRNEMIQSKKYRK